jgi:hypothetical protein
MTEGHEGWSGPEWTEPAGEPAGLAGSEFTDPGHEHGLFYDDLSDPDGPPGHPGHPDAVAEPADAESVDAGSGPTAGHGPAAEAGSAAEPHESYAGIGHDSQPEHPAEPAEWAGAELPESVVDDPEPGAPGAELPFPPALELDVTPVDGQPWVDPELLGGDHPLEPAGPEPVDPPAALLADLHAADGGGDEPASAEALAASDDPAIRALTAYWSR